MRSKPRCIRLFQCQQSRFPLKKGMPAKRAGVVLHAVHAAGSNTRGPRKPPAPAVLVSYIPGRVARPVIPCGPQGRLAGPSVRAGTRERSSSAPHTPGLEIEPRPGGQSAPASPRSTGSVQLPQALLCVEKHPRAGEFTARHTRFAPLLRVSKAATSRLRAKNESITGVQCPYSGCATLSGKTINLPRTGVTCLFYFGCEIYKAMPENPQACLWDEWHPFRAGVFRARRVP